MTRPVSILHVLLPAVLLILATAGPALAAPPPNDDPSGAELIPSAGPFPFYSAVTPDISDATTTGEPVPGCAFNGNFSRSIWYVFAPPYSTQYVVATDVSGTTVSDTVLAIYTSAGGAGGPFTEVACDDDGGAGLQSRLTTSLTAGMTYWIQASMYGTAPPAAGATAVQLLADTAWPLGTPLTTAFTYQGTLNRDGSPVTDTCDLRFTLFDAATGGIQRGLPQTLPGYFDALNADDGITYQLTCIGGYAPVHVAQEVQGNTFTIGGGTPGLRVSWQITAVHDDPYLHANRLAAEVGKAPAERGRYLYPQGYGKSAGQSILNDQAAPPPDPGLPVQDKEGAGKAGNP